MPRRLQFSLLGLLLLTAAVAIGVKWWQGPHLEIRPLTEQEAVSIFGFRSHFFKGSTIETEYRNGLHVREITKASLSALNPRVNVAETDWDKGGDLTFFLNFSDDPESMVVDRVVRVILLDPKTNDSPNYLITERGRIYDNTDRNYIPIVQLIDLSHIKDECVRIEIGKQLDLIRKSSTQ